MAVAKMMLNPEYPTLIGNIIENEGDAAGRGGRPDECVWTGCVEESLMCSGSEGQPAAPAVCKNSLFISERGGVCGTLRV